MRASLSVVVACVCALLLIGGCAGQAGASRSAQAGAEAILQGDVGDEPNLREAWGDLNAGRLEEARLKLLRAQSQGEPRSEVTRATVKCRWLLLKSTLEQDSTAFTEASIHIKAAEQLLNDLDTQIADVRDRRPDFESLAPLRDHQKRIVEEFKSDHLAYVQQCSKTADELFDRAHRWYWINNRVLIRQGLAGC